MHALAPLERPIRAEDQRAAVGGEYQRSGMTTAGRAGHRDPTRVDRGRVDRLAVANRDRAPAGYEPGVGHRRQELVALTAKAGADLDRTLRAGRRPGVNDGRTD